jgi:hypothetical protein
MPIRAVFDPPGYGGGRYSFGNALSRNQLGEHRWASLLIPTILTFRSIIRLDDETDSMLKQNGSRNSTAIRTRLSTIDNGKAYAFNAGIDRELGSNLAQTPAVKGD